MGVRAEDILPENINAMEINGVTVRKATVAAALANAKILASKEADESQKINAKAAIRELAPALVALELHHHVTWKNPEIQKIIDEEIFRNI